MGIFRITAKNFHWINGEKDNPQDLCLHGDATAIIGDRILERSCTVSATALYLLKTLTEDHIIYEDNQMLPCCGFNFLPDKTLQNVIVLGCPNGIDWTVRHNGNDVIITLEDGTTETIGIEEYKAEVFKFADIIEDYYNSCSPKILSEDYFDRDGYIVFWNEWHRRRGSRTDDSDATIGNGDS